MYQWRKLNRNLKSLSRVRSNSQSDIYVDNRIVISENYSELEIPESFKQPQVSRCYISPINVLQIADRISRTHIIVRILSLEYLQIAC